MIGGSIQNRNAMKIRPARFKVEETVIWNIWEGDYCGIHNPHEYPAYKGDGIVLQRIWLSNQESIEELFNQNDSPHEGIYQIGSWAYLISVLEDEHQLEIVWFPEESLSSFQARTEDMELLLQEVERLVKRRPKFQLGTAIAFQFYGPYIPDNQQDLDQLEFFSFFDGLGDVIDAYFVANEERRREILDMGYLFDGEIAIDTWVYLIQPYSSRLNSDGQLIFYAFGDPGLFDENQLYELSFQIFGMSNRNHPEVYTLHSPFQIKTTKQQVHLIDPVRPPLVVMQSFLLQEEARLMYAGI